jgi:hypothetical protein
VRQLNFYNFRKVNRERNFWVYKHPLFHRDKAFDLHLLRRRTCPGVDGRKVRPDADVSGPKNGFRSPTMVSPVPPETASDSDCASSEADKSKKRKTRKTPEPVVSLESDLSTPDNGNDSDSSKKPKIEASSYPDYLVNSADRYMRGPSRLVSPEASTCPADLKEQSLLVSKVSKQLDEHAKRAALVTGKGAKKKIAPTYVSDTMRYHALTYDDEIEIFDSARGCVVERSSLKNTGNSGDDESDDESDNNATVISLSDSEEGSHTSKHVISAPIEDVSVINRVVSKLLSSTKENDSTAFVAIASFCMRTDPHDPNLGEKAIQLMSNHADLAHDFCRYKVALSPNNNHSEFMKEMFRGESDDTIRGFKTFLLNNLNDLVQETENSVWNEFQKDLTKCYGVWFNGVATSS